jgi:hypothetical protein
MTTPSILVRSQEHGCEKFSRLPELTVPNILGTFGIAVDAEDNLYVGVQPGGAPANVVILNQQSSKSGPQAPNQKSPSPLR